MFDEVYEKIKLYIIYDLNHIEITFYLTQSSKDICIE